MPLSSLIRLSLLSLCLGLGLYLPLYAVESEQALLQELDELYQETYRYHEEVQTQIDQLFQTIKPEDSPRAFIMAYSMASASAKNASSSWTFERVHALAEQLADQASLATLLQYRAIETRDQVGLDKTMQILETARLAAKKSGNEALEGLVVSEIANTYCIFNVRTEAVKTMEKSLALLRNHFDHPFALSARSTAGTILSLVFKKDESIQLTIPLFEELKHRNMYYAASIEATNLGIRFRDKKPPDPIKAMEFFDEAIKLGDKARDKDAKATALNGLGALYYKSQPAKAIPLLEEARTLFHELHDQLFETEAALVLVETYANIHEPQKARNILAQLPNAPGVLAKHENYIRFLNAIVAAEEGAFESAYRELLAYHQSWMTAKAEEEQKDLARFSTEMNLRLEEEHSRGLQISLEKTLRERQLLMSVLVLSSFVGFAMLWGLFQGRQVKRQKRLLQDIMDTVQEGILRFGMDRCLIPPYARQLEVILGQKNLIGHNILEILFPDQIESRNFINSCLDAVFGETIDAWDFNSSHFPEEICLQERVLLLLWQPIADKDGRIAHFMLIVRDDTEHRQLQLTLAHEKALLDRRNRCAIELRSVEVIRVERFLQRLAGEIERVYEMTVFKRNLHTWKGEARSLGLGLLAEYLHEWEQDLGRSREGMEPILTAYQSALKDLLIVPTQTFNSGVLELYAGLLAETRQRLVQAGFAWGQQNIHLNFETRDEAVLDCLRTILLHGLSNAVDHGFLRGARHTGAVSFSLFLDHQQDQIHIRLQDNGRGIDWGKVQKLASEQGIQSQEKSELVRVLFMDGVSTADQVSLTSGRGIGLAAIQATAQNWGGQVHLGDADRGPGTCLEVLLPWPMSRAV